MSWEFATAARVVFGPGKIQEVGPAAAGFGKRALVVTGRSPGRVKALFEGLQAHDVTWATFEVPFEPTLDVAREGIRLATREGCDLIIGCGGGSAIDAAKALAALLTNGGDPLDYLEVIGLGKPLVRPALPCIAIPTTAGTGAEVTRNAVLASPQQKVKVSLRSPTMLPSLAIVDPQLTHSVSPAVTAHAGLDALAQVIEPYVSTRANPLTDSLCRDAIARIARSLVRAYQDGEDAEARADMAQGSLFSGMALANAGLGAVHGLAGPIGGMFPAPHGAICARLLPFVIDANVRALAARQPANPVRIRYAEVGKLLTGDDTASAVDGVRWLQQTCSSLNILPLSNYGITDHDVDSIVGKAMMASSMRANPIVFAAEELRDILQRAM